MIYTTYFAKIRKLPDNVIPISIAGKAPNGYTGLQYKKLAPKYIFFQEWKKNHDNEYYIECFQKEVLDKLNPQQVITELFDLVPERFNKRLKQTNSSLWDNPYVHIALVCYEKPTDFCHRHLVAEWLIANEIKVEEYQY